MKLLSGKALFLRLFNCLIILIIGFFALTGCKEKSKKGFTPFNIPYAVDRGEEVIEFEINITEEQIYTFGLSFLVNRNVTNDAKHLLNLIGDGGRRSNGEYSNLGVPLSIHLQVRTADNDTTMFIFDKTESQIGVCSGGFDSYLKRVADIRLAPGAYNVKVKNMLAASEFAGREVKFHISRAYLGK